MRKITALKNQLEFVYGGKAGTEKIQSFILVTKINTNLYAV